MKNLFLLTMLLSTSFLFAQGIVTGTITDSEMKTPLPGANVTVAGTNNGTTTNFDGKFSLNVETTTGKIVLSYVGFQKQEIEFTVKNGETVDLGSFALMADENALGEIVVIGKGVVDVAIGRDTPVAVSTVTSKDIQRRSGNEEFPTLLRTMPSVYANTSGGGYGDSEVRVRGFDQSNTAVLLNGQPINGMEDGKMYWSNWQGVKDIASAVQVQRGLGASKLAISSVGGTINIVTQTYNSVERGYVQQEIANNNYTKSTAYYSTGANDKGWSSTYMLSYWKGDGNFYEGTEGNGLTYFFSVGYKPSDEHAFNLLLTGAPQTHDQAYQNSIGDALQYGRKYNSNWGYKDGKYYNERTNFYHKPVLNLNWDWNISEKSDLSTVVYASIGRGGGTGPLGSFDNKYNSNGQIDFDAIVANNRSLTTTDVAGNDLLIGEDEDNMGYITRASMNNHFWVGAVSNFNHKINENLEFNVGLDYRFYHGDHYRQVNDFLGLDGWRETGNGSIPNGQIVLQDYKVNLFNPTFNVAKSDQQIDYSNSEDIAYIGGFGQVEYKTDKFSTFLQGALSNQKHTRYDYFAYTLPSEQESESVENVGYNVKGGANYNINDQHNIYANAGFYSRQPFHDNVYLTYTNDINPLAENEDITGLELGYGFKSKIFSANLNAYYTKWANRTNTEEDRLDLDEDGIDEFYFSNYTQIEQTHMGLELDFISRPVETLPLTIKGFASVGNWKYSDNPNLNLIRQDDLSVVESQSGKSYVDGEKIGDAPQLSFNLGVQYNILDNLSIDADWFLYDQLFAGISPLDFTDPEADNKVVELPSYDIFRLGASYRLKLEGKKSLDFRANVDNLFNEVYLTSLSSNRAVTTDTDPGNVYRGINTSNRGSFGFDRQWSLSVKFNF